MDAEKMTPAEMLAQVNTAITTVLCGGQSYKIGSRSLTRADLALLKHRWNRRIAAGCWAEHTLQFLTGDRRRCL